MKNRDQQDTLNEKIAIIKSCIYDTYFSFNSPEQVSFNLILNRIKILIQQPIVFVLYKRDKLIGDIKYKRYFSFVVDDLHKENFIKNNLSNIEDSENEYVLDNDSLFDIYDYEDKGKYKIAVFVIERNKNEVYFTFLDNSKNKIYEYDDIKLEYDEVKYMLNHIFEGSYSYEFIKGVIYSID